MKRTLLSSPPSLLLFSNLAKSIFTTSLYLDPPSIF